MIEPVVKTYSVCVRTGTVTYRHTAYIGGEKLCAERTVSSMRNPIGTPDAIHIDAALQSLMINRIRQQLYKDAQ